jgi:hypothetical protein
METPTRKRSEMEMEMVSVGGDVNKRGATGYLFRCLVVAECIRVRERGFYDKHILRFYVNNEYEKLSMHGHHSIHTQVS